MLWPRGWTPALEGEEQGRHVASKASVKMTKLWLRSWCHLVKPCDICVFVQYSVCVCALILL